MTTTQLLAPLLLTFAVVSCAPDRPANTYVEPTPSMASAPAVPSNPVYDTPPAYEETSASTSTEVIPTTPPEASGAPIAPKPSVNGAAIIHTVVAGDTLSGISAKYKVPVAAIKAANGMTKDTVILGKKMAIPPVN
jgi:LysM repeat protein